MMVNTSLFQYSPSQVPIFDGEHYDYWSNQMMTFFISQHLWEVVDEGYEEQAQPASLTGANQKQYKEIVKKNANALRYIQQGVSKSIFPRIYGVNKEKAAWEILQLEFQGSEKVVSQVTNLVERL